MASQEQLTKTHTTLVTCKGCGKLVPRTNLCLYCGAPILFRKVSGIRE